MTKVEKFKNGTTFIFEEMPNTNSVIVMVGVGVGSINETEKENGLAHFFEHMCFKGTKKYKSTQELFTAIDSTGTPNAQTQDEITAYYIRGLPKNLDKMVEIVSEIYNNSIFPVEEIEKEKGVVIQEQKLYEDNMIHKAEEICLEEQLFKGTPVGKRTLGTRESVESFSRDDLVAFFNKHYNSKNTFISIIGGGISYDKAKKLAEKYFTDIRDGEKAYLEEVKPSQNTPKVAIHSKKDRKQASIFIGFPSLLYDDKKYYHLIVLDSILDNGFSSRLKTIREELGACYFIGSTVEAEKTFGYYGIVAGIDAKMIKEVIKVIVKELKKLKEENIGEEELRKFKDLTLLSLNIGNENLYGKSIRAINQCIKLGKVIPLDVKKERINKVTADEVRAMANKLFTKDKVKCAITGLVDEGIKQEIEELLDEL